MQHPMDEWKCSMCSLTVWRYRTQAERRDKTLVFRHSKIHADGNDPLCAGRISRTGKTREGYIDDTYQPQSYDAKQLQADTRWYRQWRRNRPQNTISEQSP